MLQEAHCIVTGKVQGVFYRSFAQRTATLLGLVGYAKNLPDGNVELVAQGPQATVDEFLRRCREGPPGAMVDDVTCTWRPARGQHKRFETH
ncbi:MAG: acylphosphatase [Nanoarchaeota archaeon]